MKKDGNGKLSGSPTEEYTATTGTCSDETAKSSQEDKDRKILKTVLELAAKRRTSSTLHSINWQQVAEHVGDGYEAGDLHKRFTILTSKVRKMRTTAEIISDALAILGRPSKPPGPYLLFMRKLRKKYPDVSPKEIFKLGGDKWKTLKDSKKKRYIEKGQRLKAEYKIRLTEWKKNNSQDDNTDIRSPTSGEQQHCKGKKRRKGKAMLGSTAPVMDSAPQLTGVMTKEKMMSPFELYAEVKRPSLAQKHPTLSPQSLTAKLNRRWNRLSETKKEKYALKSKSKEYEKATNGALSGYLVFCRHNRSKVKLEHPDLNPSDLNKTLGAMWRSLNEKEKDRYNALARE